MPDTVLGPDGFPKSKWMPPDSDFQMAPGGEAAARAMGITPPVPHPQAPVRAAAPPVPPKHAEPFVPAPLPPSPHGAASRKAVPLQHPFTFDGRSWTEIHVRRFTAGQVATIMRNHLRERESDPDAPLLFPSFVDASGAEIPESVMAALDDDDMTTVQEAAQAFLPRRFRPDPAPKADASGPNTGASTAA